MTKMTTRPMHGQRKAKRKSKGTGVGRLKEQQRKQAVGTMEKALRRKPGGREGKETEEA